MDAQVKLHFAPRFRFTGLPGSHLGFADSWFPDGHYRQGDLLTRVRAMFAKRLTGRNDSLQKVVTEVVSELLETARCGTISHLVVYGSRRLAVLGHMLYVNNFPRDLPVILSEKEVERGALTAQTIGFELPVGVASALPDLLDYSDSNLALLLPEIVEKLYTSGRLIRPYQIDTDRYPFTKRFT